MTSSGKNGLDIFFVQMGQDQVSGVSVPLLASRTRCNVLWKPPKFGNKVKIGNKSSSVISSQIGVMSDQLSVSAPVRTPGF